MQYYLIYTVNLFAPVIGLLLLAYMLLSWFMSPFHPIRQAIGSIVDPMLNPIRQVLPPMAGLDFSPLVLWLLVRLLSNLAVNLISLI